MNGMVATDGWANVTDVKATDLAKRFADAVYPQRPKGFIHSDLFRDNTLFADDHLQGILDFYELNQDELLFDIAITLNDFCTDFPELSLNQATRFV